MPLCWDLSILIATSPVIRDLKLRCVGSNIESVEIIQIYKLCKSITVQWESDH